MSKTTNYQLTLWDYADEDFSLGLAREDLAANFTKLDTALKAEATAWAAAVAAEANARTASLAKKVEVVIGTYLGQQTTLDVTTRHIALGFRPRAVILGNAEHFSYTGVLAIDQTTSGTHRVEIENNGFRVINCSAYYTDQSGQCYVYIAFR